MPDFTIASAICRIKSSLTLHANLFQLFHPMGGVRASLLSWATSSDGATSRLNIAIRILVLANIGSDPNLSGSFRLSVGTRTFCRLPYHQLGYDQHFPGFHRAL